MRGGGWDGLTVAVVCGLLHGSQGLTGQRLLAQEETLQ